MFVSPAYAQAGGASGPGGIEMMLPLILIFVVFYFLLIRPQQKKQKDQRASLASIRRGDKVTTNGGIVGTVTKVVDDDYVMVEIAEDVKVRVNRWHIAGVIAKTEPIKAGAKKDDAPKGDGGDGSGNGGGSGGSMLKKLLGGKS